MSESVRDLLVRGIAAAKSKESGTGSSKGEARHYLEWVLRLDASLDQQIEAWYWLSEISEDPVEKRHYLEEVLANQPNYYLARRSLAILDGKLDPREIVNPDRMPVPSANSPQTTQAQRFVCPTCGGRLTYTPDGTTLTCEYCDQRQKLISPQTGSTETFEETDFTIALASAKGHTRPSAMRIFECQACGASFVLSPQTLSLTCPYCAAVYVVKAEQTRLLIPPDAIIPFKITQEEAQQTLLTWLAMHREVSLKIPQAHEDPLRGFYLPTWCFNLTGYLPWKGLEYDDREWKPTSGYKLVLNDNLLIPAGRKLPEVLAKEIDTFNLACLVPYDPAYLADWPAETYQISLSDASLDARQQALAKAQAALPGDLIKPVRDLQIDSSALLVESFKLILLPLWVSHYHIKEKNYPLLINGQNGKVSAEIPDRGSHRWLAWLNG